MYNFFSSVNLPQPSHIQKEQLNKPVNKEKIIKAVNKLPNNKTPGPDGLTLDFIKLSLTCCPFPSNMILFLTL